MTTLDEAVNEMISTFFDDAREEMVSDAAELAVEQILETEKLGETVAEAVRDEFLWHVQFLFDHPAFEQALAKQVRLYAVGLPKAELFQLLAHAFVKAD
jgi:hypothetical protein